MGFDAAGLALGGQLIVYGVTNGAIVALNAVGFTLAYGVARQINLAHGNVFALASVVVASLVGLLGVTTATALPTRLAVLALLVLVAVLCGAGLNLLVEWAAFRPFQAAGDRLGPLIASVALSFIFLQVAVWWHGLTTVQPEGITIHQGVDRPLQSVPDLIPAIELGAGGVSLTLKDGLVLALAGAVAIGVGLVMTRTRTGRLLRAVAQDAELAALVGADPRRARALAFALAGGLAGFAAAIFAIYHGGATGQHGLRSGLAAMTAAVLGGVGSPRGALVGGVALGVAASFSDYLLDARWTPVLTLSLLIALLTVRPTGLLGGVESSGATSLAVLRRAGTSSGWLLLLLGLGIAYPLVDAAAGWQRLPSVAAALLLVTLAVGLSMVVGMAGLLDLGYAAFFALGGYSAALLTSSASRLGSGLPDGLREPWLALPLAGMVAAGFGLLFGIPSVRTRGEYLALVTLAFGEIVPSVIWHLPEWTGGPRGMSGVLAPRLGPWPPFSPLNAYALALGLAVLAGLVAHRLADGRVGRAWAATREDDVAAAAVGIVPARARLLAFALGAAVAGIAGALYAGQFGYVDPEQFDLTVSLMALAAVVIGGRWGLPGVIVGALVVAGYERLLVDGLNGAVHALGAALGLAGLAALDLRAHNFAIFGLALYLATRARAGRAEAEPIGAARSVPASARPRRS